MWEKITAFIMSQLLPASIFSAGNFFPTFSEPAFQIPIQPLAIQSAFQQEPLVLDAKSFLVLELNSNEALVAKQIFEPLPIASLTKLMTALMVAETLDFSKEVTVSKKAVHVAGSKMGLLSGETITVQDLLKGLLISSGNDAAIALSEAVSGKEENFVALMNQRAKSLGLEKTRFVDPAGLSDENISSAFEIAHLAKRVFEHPVLQTMMRVKKTTVYSSNKKIPHELINTNLLLETGLQDRILAGKTGTTPLAGECLISFFRRSDGKILVMVILGSKNRYDDVQKLLSWTEQQYTW